MCLNYWPNSIVNNMVSVSLFQSLAAGNKLLPSCLPVEHLTLSPIVSQINFMEATKVATRSWAQDLLHSQHCFTLVLSDLCLLQPSLPVLNLVRRKCYILMPHFIWTLHRPLFSVFKTVVSFCINHNWVHREMSLMRSESLASLWLERFKLSGKFNTVSI